MSAAGYSTWDSSVVHDTISQRRYFIATLCNGLVVQFGLMRTFTIYYRKPPAPPRRPQRQSRSVRAMEASFQAMDLFSQQCDSRAIEKVYLIRLYTATITILALVIIFTASAGHTFMIPYMFQVRELEPAIWADRFRSLTAKILALPLLLGVLHALFSWRSTRLNAPDIDALFRLKQNKELRILGEDTDQDVDEALEAEAMMRSLARARDMGSLTTEQADQMESFVMQARAERELAATEIEELRNRIERQVRERAAALGAIKSSQAFLTRGFRDIEMLLDAGFVELESKRGVFMGTGRQEARQRFVREKAWRAARAGLTVAGAVAEGEDGGGSPSPDRRLGGGGSSSHRQGDEDEDEDEDSDVEKSSSDDDGELSSIASSELAAMDYDELQRMLATNEAQSRRLVQRRKLQFVDEEDGDPEAVAAADADPAQQAVDAEAADVRRSEFFSLAQSAMGRTAQLADLQEKTEKERAAAAALKQALEERVSQEQTILKKWERLDEQLQEVEVDKASFLSGKQREKEVALEKAQHAEAALEQLKDKFRELRRREEQALKAADDAQASGESQARELEHESALLRRKRETATEQLQAGEVDRRALFAETQRVEHELRRECVRKAESQQAAERYRNMLTEIL